MNAASRSAPSLAARLAQWPLLLPLAITVGALLPWNPVGPFDARTMEPLADAHLDYPLSGALLEPAAAIGHALSGAPDPKLAALATLAWVLAGGLLWGGWRRRRAGGAVLVGAARGAGLAGLGFLAYVGLYFLVPFPSWELTPTERAPIVADLQTHTHGSHDSIVTPRTNLRTLADRGVEVVAITEHKDPGGAFAARELAQSAADLPGVIPGVELQGPEGYVLGLGVLPDMALPDKLRTYGEVDRFTERMRTAGGATIALGWKLRRPDVDRMAAAGIDGFEIANMGHPDVPAPVRRRLLTQAEERGLVLAASSDWHGWTGTWRTWTLVRPAAGATGEPTQQVLHSLRQPATAEITPAVAGRIGPPATWRVALAPVVESVRYAAELDAARVAGWWLWAGVALLAGRALRRRNHAPAAVLGRAALATVGIALLFNAAPLAFSPAAAAVNPAFHQKIGNYGLLLGGLALLVALTPALRAFFRRHLSPRGNTGPPGHT